MLSLGYARVLIGLLVHVRCCAQRLYILTTSKDSGGHESLAPLFWGSWAEKFGNPCSSTQRAGITGNAKQERSSPSL